MLKIARLLTAVAAAVSMAACGGIASPSSQTSTDFSGVVQPLGQASKEFSVSKTGELEITLQSLSPRPVVGFLAVAVGQPTGGFCAALGAYIVSQAATGQQYAFPQITRGTYCVLVADANGVLTAPAAFTLRLVHP